MGKSIRTRACELDVVCAVTVRWVDDQLMGLRRWLIASRWWHFNDVWWSRFVGPDGQQQT